MWLQPHGCISSERASKATSNVFAGYILWKPSKKFSGYATDKIGEVVWKFIILRDNCKYKIRLVFIVLVLIVLS